MRWLPAVRVRALQFSWTGVLSAMRVWHLLPELSGLSRGRNRRIVGALVMSDLAVSVGSMLAGPLLSSMPLLRQQGCEPSRGRGQESSMRYCPPTPQPLPPLFLPHQETCSPEEEVPHMPLWHQPLWLILPSILVLLLLWALVRLRREQARQAPPVLRERLELCRYLRGGGSLVKLAEATFLSMEQVVLQLLLLEEEVGQVVSDAAEVSALAGISTPMVMSEEEEEEEEES